MKKILSIIIASVMLVPAFAQLDRSLTPKAGPAPVINIPDPVIFTLDNGITVILSENHKTPRFSFNLVMGSDPQLEKDKAGLSKIAGELILSGTTDMSKDDLDKTIDMMGVSFSADENSIFASGLSKHRKSMLDILTQVLNGANFPQSEFDRIVKQSQSALAMAKSEANQIAENILKTVDFGRNHPYGEIMTEETLANITRDDVASYFKHTFTPKGAYLVVVGDVTKDDLSQLLNNSIAKWTGGEKTTANYTLANNNEGTRVVFVKKPGAVQSVIHVTFPISVKPGDVDQIPLNLMNNILGGGTFEAKLMQNLREDKAYTYGCYSSVNIDRYGSYFSTKGSFRNEVTDSAIVEILKEIRSMKSTEGVSQAQLDLAKATTMGSFSRALESPQTIARFALSTIQNNLAKDYFKNYLKNVELVSLADIKSMADKYLNVDKAFIVVVGNEDIADKLKKFDSDGNIEFLDAYGNKEAGFKPADISLEDVLEKVVLATTQQTSMKAASKMLSKIKTMKQVIKATPAGAPVSLDMITYFQSPNMEAMEVQFNGNMMQRQFFNGKAGGSESSPMAGGKSSELSAEEIAEKNKTAGLVPEINYIANKVNAQLLGITEEKGKKMYVVEVKSNDELSRSYYDVTSFLKVKTISTSKDDEGKVQEATVEYSDFKNESGLMLPQKMAQQFGPMTLSAEVKSIEINKKIDGKVFVK
jgi:predicted Zn-dependent peptidase